MAVRLHIGCGSSPIEGWVNVDIQGGAGVDRVLDVRRGLPFRNVELIFAEHFVEHLTLEENLAFLAECRRILLPEGVLRLSTPNLDWTWLSHYREPDSLEGEEALLACLRLNRAFHGWGHKFLYNEATLTAALATVGFGEFSICEYGESRRAALAGLERHETYPDAGGESHIVILEAWGVAEPSTDFTRMAAEYLRDLAIR